MKRFERDSASYMTGFGNHFSTEAVAGALPVGRNAPQKPPFGLYTEQFSGTAFTAPRSANRRSWLYRLRPSAAHGAFAPYRGASQFLGSLSREPFPPNRLRWKPIEFCEETDWLDGLTTMVVAGGGPTSQTGVSVHIYHATRDMERRAFVNADGELILIPERGCLSILTEFGRIDIQPTEIAILPRGVRFRVTVPDDQARGYVAENFGLPFCLPELGPIGANGLANPRDFETPVAWFEDIEGDFELVQKFRGALWTTNLGRSPLDVVAWHGNLAPCKYDLSRFNAINTVSFDHPDPSIFTVLTSPSDVAGTANADFVIFPPRWVVAEDTFRPPWFHRNVMSECMGLITGAYDAKAEGFSPGALSLHNQMSGHGPDLPSWTVASEASLQPYKITESMAFMVESRWVFSPTDYALRASVLDKDYDAAWQGFPKAELPPV